MDPATLVDVAYGYDRAGNRLWRRDNKAHSLGGAEAGKHDAFYGRDGFYQVTGAQRGNLTGTAPDYTGITSVQRAEDWCYDATGNWQEYVDDLPGSGSDLAQLRTHNKANGVTSFSAPGTVPTPAYDAVGNMTSVPKPSGWDAAYTLKCDAWNRLVEVIGASTVQTNRYDGLTRRITEDDQTNVRHFYYNDQWRSVEEYLGSAGTPERLHLWGARSRWDLVLRQRDSDDNDSLDEELNVLADAMDPGGRCRHKLSSSRKDGVHGLRPNGVHGRLVRRRRRHPAMELAVPRGVQGRGDGALQLRVPVLPRQAGEVVVEGCSRRIARPELLSFRS